jgi:hypothetical protein
MCCSIRACWRPRSHESPSGQRPQEPLASISRFLSRANATSPIASHHGRRSVVIVVNAFGVVVRIHQSRRHRRPPSTPRSRRGCTSKGLLIIGACTRVAWLAVFASYRAVIQESKLVWNESSGKSSCWSVDSFMSMSFDIDIDFRQVQIADLSSCHDDDYEVHTFLSNRLQVDSHFHALGFPDSPCRALIHANRCRT